MFRVVARGSRAIGDRPIARLRSPRRASLVRGLRGKWLCLCVGSLRSRTRGDRIEPTTQIQEVVQLLPLSFPRNDPRIGGHVRDRVGVADQERAIRETAIDNSIKPIGLTDVSVDCIRDFLQRIDAEVMVLTSHGTETAHSPEQPLGRGLPIPQVGRKEQAGLFGEVKKDRARLEDSNRLAVIDRIVVDDGRHSIFGENARNSGLN